MSFDVLQKRILDKKNPMVMGLDPKLEYVPSHLVADAVAAYGETPQAAAEAIWLFNKALIDATVDLIPAVKPQSAYYEMYGLAGLAVLSRTIKYARSKGLYVILDAKRGDIGATSEAYASYLNPTAVFGKKICDFEADCMTVNPYLGVDGVKPFIDVAVLGDKSIFVLVKTSNKSSADFQDVITADGLKMYEKVAASVKNWGADSVGKSGFSKVGAVVGATFPKELEALRAEMPETFFLIPGYGAQGGAAQDIKPAFKSGGTGAIVNSSRAVMCAYQKTNEPEKFDIHARDEVKRMKESLNSVIT